MTDDGPFAIIGLGLIGGSLARDLAAQGETVWAYDTDHSVTRRARRAGVLGAVMGADLAQLARARTVVFAVPVDVAPVLLERTRAFLDGAALITDVGSTKRRIVAAAAALGLSRFVGSHPMAGDVHAGWAASRTGLFAGARVDLCRNPGASADAWRRARALWTRVGARPSSRDAHAHDAELALSSHLPQVLSLALAGALSARGIARSRLGPGGDAMTRLAASPADTWIPILDDGAAHITDAIDTMEAALGALRTAVAHKDHAALRAVFAAAHRWMGTPPAAVRSATPARRQKKSLAGDDR